MRTPTVQLASEYTVGLPLIVQEGVSENPLANQQGSNSIPQLEPKVLYESAELIDKPNIPGDHEVNILSMAALPNTCTLFEDPILSSLIDNLVQRNPSVRESLARIAAARATYDGRKAELRPEIGMNDQYAFRRLSQNGNAFIQKSNSTTGFNWTSTGLDSSWEIDMFGQLRKLRDAAELDVCASQATHRGLMVTLVGDLIAAYVEYSAINVRLRIADENISLQRYSVELARELLSAGTVGELDIAQAEAQLHLTMARVPRLVEIKRQTLHRLLLLQGINPGSRVDDSKWGTMLPFPPPVRGEELPAEWLAGRPDVRAAKFKLQAQAQRIAATKLQNYPKLVLNGGISLQTRGIDEWWSPESLAHDVGPSLNWSFLDFGRTKAATHLELARYKEALSAYQQLTLNASEEVQNALTSANLMREQGVDLSLAVSSCRRVLEIALVEYREGLTNFQNVLDANRQFLQAEDSLILAMADAWVANVQIFKALGGYGQGFVLASNTTSGKQPSNGVQSPQGRLFQSNVRVGASEIQSQ